MEKKGESTHVKGASSLSPVSQVDYSKPHYTYSYSVQDASSTGMTKRNYNLKRKTKTLSNRRLINQNCHLFLQYLYSAGSTTLSMN